jgi:hypothetical protein
LEVSALFAGTVCAIAAAMQIERMPAAIAPVIDFGMNNSPLSLSGNLSSYLS